jgi:peptidoglycan/LPS O-acetylase OafA/YrhL
VLAVHGFWFLTPETLPPWMKTMAAPFWIGVNIFFVLSGFLITGILIDTKSQPHFFKSFYVRRVLRIFPLYFGVLALSFVALPAFHLVPRPSPSEQFWYWSYLSNWGSVGGHAIRSLSHFWSLAVEEQFYLVWPFVIFVIPRRYLTRLCFACIAGSFLFRVGVFVWGFPTTYAYVLTPARAEDLAMGALAACFFRDALWLERIRRAAPFIAGFCVAAFIIICVGAHGFESTKALPVVFGTSVISLSSALLVLAAVDSHGAPGGLPARLRRLLAGSVLRWLGVYSYGIYVFHLPMIVLLHSHVLSFVARLDGSQRLVASLFSIVVVVAASCAVAFASYHLFEKHFLALKRSFQPG